MEQYIPKSALVAKINKIYNEDYKFLSSDIADNVQNFKDDLLMNLDTLEVKDVDLKKEIDLVEDKYRGFESLSRADIIAIARYFFELGLKAQKGE
jgi:hypothetical protein